MDIKKFIRISVGLKLGLMVLCVFLIKTHFITGQSGEVLLDNTKTIDLFISVLNSGVNVNYRNKDGFTALMLAAQRGDLERARMLLARGADVNLKSYTTKQTALHLAASSADQNSALEIVLLLLQHGAHVNAKDTNGNTPLHSATNVRGSYENRTKVFAYLIKNGGDINAQNNNGSTPLHMIVGMFDVQGIQTLIPLFGQLFDLTKKTKKQKFTPIQFAKDIGAINIVQLLQQPLVPLGILGNVNDYNDVGFTGLMLAVIAKNSALAQQLLNRGADVNLRSQDLFNYSPLQFALLHKNLAMVEFLLKKNGNPSLPNAAGDTAMQIVLRIPDITIQKRELDLLAKYNANFNAKDKKGDTILHGLVRENNKPLLEYMVKNFKRRLNIGIQNLNYETPIALSRKLGHQSLIPLLEKLR